MKTACTKMGDFYASCGEMVTSYVIESGAFPKTTYTSVFEYANGEARFDGSRWTWVLGKAD